MKPCKGRSLWHPQPRFPAQTTKPGFEEDFKTREFSLSDVQIPKNVSTAMYSFMEFFKGFEKLPVVRSIFGDDTEKVLQELKVEGFHFKGVYMATDGKDGHLLVNAYFLREGEQLALYLAVICELVHVRQFREGKSLFDDRFEYADRPTELEAYKLAIDEARRLGMSEKGVFEYLKAGLGENDARKLAKNLGVKVHSPAGVEENATKEFSLPDVQISRSVPTATYGFTEFFKGFEKVAAVREIFGKDAEKVLRELRVEFVHLKGVHMGVDEGNGHLEVDAYYLEEGRKVDLYLDVIHELVHIRQFREGKPLFDDKYEYVDRPTELEAYKLAVDEARRLGMSEKEVFEYLKADQMSEGEVRKLAKNLGVL